MSTTAHMSAMMLDKETDARFWAQTGYKPGQKLDMGNPTDKAMAKVWNDIHAKVVAEDHAGRLVLTYNHPIVEQHNDNARQATAAAIAHTEAAAVASDAGDHARAARHQDTAAKAAQIATASSAEAAKLQPPTVSPEVAHAAAIEASTNNAVPPPAQPTLPAGHPANHHPNAYPAHPDLATPGAPIPAHPARRGRGPQHRHQDATVTIVPHPRQGHGDATTVIIPISEYGTTADYVALAQAQAGGEVAAQVHANAATSPAPVSTIRPEDQASIRAMAKARATQSPSPFVGVVLGRTGIWEVKTFPDTEHAQTWYGEVQGLSPSPYKYLAVFDKTGKALGWPEAVYDAFGDASALLVDVSPDRQVTREVAVETMREVKEKGGNGGVIAMGAVAVTGIVAALASRKHRHF